MSGGINQPCPAVQQRLQNAKVTTMATNLSVGQLNVGSFTMGPIKKDNPTFFELKKGSSYDIEDSFDGPLPNVGDRVEMVCVGRDRDLSIKIQLRVIKEDRDNA